MPNDFGAHRANAVFDAHRDGPEFEYRFLLDEARHAGQEMAERTAWRICRTNRWWSVFGTPGRGKHKRPGPPVHDDLVERQFTAQEPNQVRLTNISEHTTREGKIYLCPVKDVFSGRIVGSWIDARMKPLWRSRHWRTPWHVGQWRASQRSDASCTRVGAVTFVPGGCSTHSTATRWSDRWAGVRAAGDNAVMESFFGLLQNNVLNRRQWATREELRIAIVTWIERTHHRRRRQHRLGKFTPTEHETMPRPAVSHAA